MGNRVSNLVIVFTALAAAGSTACSQSENATESYRAVVYADVAPNCGEGDEFSRVTVEVDVIEREILRWWDTAGCDS